MVSDSHAILKKKPNTKTNPNPHNQTLILLTAWIEFKEMQLLFLQSEKYQEKAKSVFIPLRGDLLLKPNNDKAVDSTATCFITDYFSQK